MTIGFRSPAYEVAEGEGVEVTVEMRGETNIDVVVNVATQDSTAGGEDIEYFECIKCLLSLPPLPSQVLRTTPVLTRPSLSQTRSQFTTSPSVQLTTISLKETSYSNSSSLSLDHPAMESCSLKPSSPMSPFSTTMVSCSSFV